MPAPKKNEKPKPNSRDVVDFDAFMDSVIEQTDGVRDITAKTDWFSSGIIAANLALSGDPNKGMPWGRMINFEGLSDTGKSLLAQTCIREAQKAHTSNFRCLYIDTERGVSMERLEQMGLFVRRKPKNKNKPNRAEWEDDTGDPRASTFRTIVTQDVSKLADEILPPFFEGAKAHPEMRFILCFDSISMLQTSHETDTTFDTQDMARAKVIRKLMRILNAATFPNMTIFCIHHQTTRISTTGMLSAKQGSHERDVGGGTSVKYTPDVRLEVDYIGKEKRGSGEDAVVVGQQCRIRVVKSRLYKPMLEAKVVIDHNCGFTVLGGLFEQLVDLKLVEAKGDRWTCKKVLGDKSFFKNNLQDELEKSERVSQVAQLIMESMQIVAFGEGDNKSDAEDEPEA
jgi:recombination protein RecA